MNKTMVSLYERSLTVNYKTKIEIFQGIIAKGVKTGFWWKIDFVSKRRAKTVVKPDRLVQNIFQIQCQVSIQSIQWSHCNFPFKSDL